MSRNPVINTPIATKQGNSACLTLPWFVQGAEYCPDQATFKPLVNGAEAFGAVYDAIAAAERTVDIICWGFQPSMYFKRGPEGQGSLRIGELLEAKGKQGVKIRLLVWTDSLHLAAFSENMTPGNNVASRVSEIRDSAKHKLDRLWSSKTGEPISPIDTRNSAQREFDRQWYWRANLTNVTKQGAAKRFVKAGGKVPAAVSSAVVDAGYNRFYKDESLTNIQFATRDFDLVERAEIAWRSWMESFDTSRPKGTKAGNAAAMAGEPSHHQKMVLVDYEYPKQAIGFVMGHNTLDEYWDTDSHSAYRMHPQMGRCGGHPRQDISSRVTGSILGRLNHNFCQAWDDATGQNLAQERAAADDAIAKIGVRRGFDTPVMAQILRTQSQHGKGGTRDIEKAYLKAVNNATNFVYIENQYFRYLAVLGHRAHLPFRHPRLSRAAPI